MPAPFEELVAAFVDAVVDSFEKLAVILALAECESPLDEATLTERAQLDFRSVREACSELVDAHVVARIDEGAKDKGGAVCFGIDRAGTWSQHVDALRSLHASNRTRVITMMSDAALKRLRNQTDRIFADAFVINWRSREKK